MKIKRNLLTTCFAVLIAFICASTTATARNTIEGVWVSSKDGIRIEVQDFDRGIEVRRLDNNEAYYYNYEGNNTYIDQKGNRYLAYRDRLVFEHNRNRQITFYPLRQENRIERNSNQFDDRVRNNRWGIETFEGTWFETRSGNSIRINALRDRIRVQGRGGWRTFHAIGNGEFEDSTGDVIILERNNRIVYLDRRTRSEFIYLRERTRRYSCN